jgi:N-acetyl-gamma-glutamyl-phosphate/LysW-gamma-L-alpha-aminoadipyl-6-phosphate reductase
MVTVSILGASGYTGGELLRLLLQHPEVEVVSATSQQLAGSFVHRAHPNLRGATKLKFVGRDGLEPADVVFTCVPHTKGMTVVPALVDQGCTVVDMSADFRLADADAYAAWYGHPHTAPELLARRVYGLPERHRTELAGADLVSGVGCLATATNLALLPLAKAGLLTGARVVADVKVGSSAAGLDVNPAAIHAERSRSIRLYAPTKHRHVAEILQESGPGNDGLSVHFTAQSVEIVRGILSVCHVLLPPEAEVPDEKDLWRTWRAAYGQEPFVRIVKERQGIHRFPDPKLVAGSNYADVSFEVDAEGRRIVAVCAIDNLGKGAAGSAVQSMNLARGLNETTGLTQLPLHPV